jgi:hypothetical protein
MNMKDQSINLMRFIREPPAGIHLAKRQDGLQNKAKIMPRAFACSQDYCNDGFTLNLRYNTPPVRELEPCAHREETLAS